MLCAISTIHREALDITAEFREVDASMKDQAARKLKSAGRLSFGTDCRRKNLGTCVQISAIGSLSDDLCHAPIGTCSLVHGWSGICHGKGATANGTPPRVRHTVGPLSVLRAGIGGCGDRTSAVAGATQVFPKPSWGSGNGNPIGRATGPRRAIAGRPRA